MFETRLPLSVAELTGYLPHRDPAIWIDRVCRVNAEGGECSLTLTREAGYFGPQGLRRSSCLEWIAQSYGYVVAAREFLSGNRTTSERVFLAGIRGLVFPSPESLISLGVGQELRVQVRRTHEMGPLSVVDGVVLAGNEAVARANLKLFAATQIIDP